MNLPSTCSSVRCESWNETQKKRNNINDNKDRKKEKKEESILRNETWDQMAFFPRKAFLLHNSMMIVKVANHSKANALSRAQDGKMIAGIAKFLPVSD